jgi:hypothetical protein
MTTWSDRTVSLAGGPLELSLFDRQDLAEISSPDYLGERLIACHGQSWAAERAAHRQRLLTATEAELTKIEGVVTAGRPKDPPRSASAPEGHQQAESRQDHGFTPLSRRNCGLRCVALRNHMPTRRSRLDPVGCASGEFPRLHTWEGIRCEAAQGSRYLRI